MGRASTKEDLIQSAEGKFDEMWTVLETISEKDQLAAFAFDPSFLEKKKEAHWRRDTNIKDVLIHLYEWHQLLLKWIQDNQAGKDVSFIPAPYNWRTYGELNQQFVLQHKNTSLNEAKEQLFVSHREVMKLIKSFTNDELFSKNIFAWTGSSTLGAYCVSSTASHYEWATKKMKQYKKMLK